MRKEFERVTPESVGLRSADILQFLEDLAHSETEMHGLMIMRHGKVAAEGWWAPFAPHLRHGLQSHSKTYAATAVGLAYTEGYLKLNERVIDIFPDEAPENPSENLKLLTVRDVLCMGCGMDTMPRDSEHWIRDFLATPVNHKPGTTYMYNSVGSTFLCAIVAKKTGIDAHEYLKTRLFDKIGIDESNLRWYRMADGTPMGGGGLFATTEDNLRLMKLYADGGVWEGERILAEDYVKLATSLQNESATEANNNPLATDNHVGYGFQIWMCKPEGVYRADGAMGQFTIVCPKQDLIIAINETAVGAHWAQSTLDICWKYLAKVEDDHGPLGEGEDTEKLARTMRQLALDRPAYQPFSSMIEKINGKRFEIESGKISFELFSFMAGKAANDIKAITFNFDNYGIKCDYETAKGCESIRIATDGERARNIMGKPEDCTQILLCDAHWAKENELVVHARWVETCLTKTLVFTFTEDGFTAKEDSNSAFRFPGEVPPAIGKMV